MSTSDVKLYLGVFKNRGTPKSSILIRFSIINHPFWGTPIFGNTHLSSGDLLWKSSLIGNKPVFIGTISDFAMRKASLLNHQLVAGRR